MSESSINLNIEEQVSKEITQSQSLSNQQQNIGISEEKGMIKFLHASTVKTCNNAIIDLKYFDQFKKTFKGTQYSSNDIIKPISAQKNSFFTSISLENTTNFPLQTTEQLRELLSLSKQVAKFQKIKQLLTSLRIVEEGKVASSQRINFSENQMMTNELSLMKAEKLLRCLGTELYKFNVYFEDEISGNHIYLQHGMSISALSALEMSADFYMYTHLRFGTSPFVDRFYAKNYIEIELSLLQQKSREIGKGMDQCSKNFKKRVRNLSSIGAIYEETQTKLFDLGGGYFLEIHFYSDPRILKAQIQEINNKLRSKSTNFSYFDSSKQFIDRFYPNSKLWSARGNNLEVDSDLIDKFVKQKKIIEPSFHSIKSLKSQQECSTSPLFLE